MHRIIYIILWGLLLSASVVQASEINLLPKPQHVNYTGKWYKLGDVRLVTPVHADDYTAFVEEAGGQVKEKASRKFGDFKIHCMMDEIGKLHPNNVKGILDFANCRNILLVNSSPTTYNVEDYKYTYLLNKDGHSNTQVVPLLKYSKA